MLHSLVIGLGRCGAGLHVPVLLRARTHPGAAGRFADAPIVGFDDRTPAAVLPAGVLVADTLAHARTLAHPDRTVVHVCTPPTVRVAIVEQLAELGYRMILVEKPLALDVPTLTELIVLTRRWGLRLAVVSHWLTSALTDRLQRVIGGGRLGSLRSISVVQRKPRYARSLDGDGHESAFDVEIPHSVALAMSLAGPARLLDAGWSDLVVEDTVLPGLGTAWLTLLHPHGVRTQILSDLSTPIRERRITLRFDSGALVGHYPSSAADPYAQLRTVAGPVDSRAVFADDALTTFFHRTYADFAGLTEPVDTSLPATPRWSGSSPPPACAPPPASPLLPPSLNRAPR